MKEILVEVGTKTLSNTKYDSIGLDPDETVLTIGFRNNIESSIMIKIEDQKMICYFNDKLSSFETLSWWFNVGEHIPCAIEIGQDYK